MSGTEDVVEQLKDLVNDARDEALLYEFLQTINRESKKLAESMGLDEKTRAFALAGVACGVADVAQDRAPVMIALMRAWPEIFTEVTPEQYDALKR